MGALKQMVRAIVASPPPFIDPADMPDIYAVPGVGTCMEPRVPNGQLLAFDKRIAPEPGDIVVLFFHQHHAARYGAPGWVKRLVIGPPPAGFRGVIAVEQLNPPRQYLVPTAHVAAIHRCIGFAAADPSGRAQLGEVL